MANVPVRISRAIVQREGATGSFPPPVADTDPVITDPLNPPGSGGGVGTFVELTDTPDNYVGQEGKVPVVDEFNNRLVFSQITNNDFYGLISGGLVQWSGTGFVFNISRAVAQFGGVFVDTVIGGQVTLSASDPTNDRVDVFFVDINGDFGVLTGTPSADPVKPQVDPLTQIELTSIIVGANTTTQPSTITELIYDENVEWSVTSSGTGTINASSTNDPYQGSVSIETTTISQDFAILFDNGSDYDTTGALVLSMWLNLKNVFFAGQELTAQFLDVSNNPISQERILSFDKSLVGTYQFVAISINDLSLTTNNVRKLRIAFRRSRGATTQGGFFLDVVEIQGGIVQPPIQTDFISLTDTPNTYSGEAGKIIAVKDDESGLEFIDPPAGGIDNLDGGFANSVYLITQEINGGGA